MSRRVTLGESSASPAATARTARSSSAGSVSFTRNPLAPARSASNTYSSSSNVVRITTRTAVERGVVADATGGGEAVDAGHADVHQHDVGALAARERDRLVAVARLADHLDVVLGVEQGPEAPAHQRLVVGEHDPDHRCPPIGNRARTRKPAACGGTDLEVTAERVDPFAHAGDALARPVSTGRAPRPSSSTCTTSASGS